MTPLDYVILEYDAPGTYSIGYRTKYCRVVKYGPFETEEKAIRCLERIKKEYREKMAAADTIPDGELKRKLCLELWKWQYHREHHSNFTILLFDLITKADCFNSYRLSLAFPNEVAIYKEWMEAPTHNCIFARYNIDWQSGQPIYGVATNGN